MDPKSMSVAFSMSSNPGVYAVLLGSGVSRSAGIKTGWDIVLDLCDKLAVALREDTDGNPVKWYEEKHGKEARYDDLLKELALTQAARQALLEQYFEPSETEREEGLKQPTSTHRMVAELVKAGYIRMILTTNFDRLMEIALTDAGVSYDVAYEDNMLKGMRPYVHSKCTIVKVHGDYKSTYIKNTEDELSTYPDDLNRFLDRVFDEFGLIIAGWSGVWDQALKEAMLRVSSRRYAWYWLARGAVDERAHDVIRHRDAVLINISDADSFFSQLTNQIESIESTQAIHPKNAALASAMTKKMISKNLSIELNDLARAESMSCRDFIMSTPSSSSDPVSDFTKQLNGYIAHTETVSAILAAISYYSKGEHHNLIGQTLARLVINRPMSGRVILLNLKLFPALFCVYVAGVAAVAADDFQMVQALLTELTVFDESGNELSFGARVHPYTVFDNAGTLLGRNPNEYTPVSNWLYDQVHRTLESYLPTDDEYERAFVIFEFLWALISIRDRLFGGDWAPLGRYYGHHSAQRIVEHFLRQGASNPKWPIVQQLFADDSESFKSILERLQGFIKEASVGRGLFSVADLMGAYSGTAS